jgi:16S rRNA (cytosine967-C5)-methyltransferase
LSRRPRGGEPLDPRAVAAEILRRVDTAGAFAAPLLEERERRFRDRRDAALLHELVLGTLRRRSALDHAIARVSNRPLEAIDPEVLRVLRLGAYEILLLDRIPGYASVDEAVESTKRRAGRAAAAFANGVLRAVSREGRALLPPEPREGDVAGLALAGSHPEWWVARLVERVGWDAAVAIVENANRPAATVLRARTGADLARRLAEEGIGTEPGRYDPRALRVEGASISSSPAFRSDSWVQDEASQLVPALLGDLGPGPVLDACAAPGGKTCWLADALGGRGEVVSVDRNPARLGRLLRATRRLRFERVFAVAADLTRPPPFSCTFPRVLVDAPCSGTGTMGRRPEIRWRLREGDLASLAARQAAILARVAPLVAKGGVLVYAVCSIEPEEGEDVVRSFLSNHPEFALDDPAPRLPEPARRFVGDDRIVRTVSGEGGLDGFQAVRLVRRYDARP